jgi:hypothetical protein
MLDGQVRVVRDARPWLRLIGLESVGVFPLTGVGEPTVNNEIAVFENRTDLKGGLLGGRRTLEQTADLLTPDDGRSPIAKKDGIIGVVLRHPIRIARFERAGERLVERRQLIVHRHNHPPRISH